MADLVKHLIGGGIMSELRLNGASKDDAMAALFNLDLEGDLRTAFADARHRQAADGRTRVRPSPTRRAGATELV